MSGTAPVARSRRFRRLLLTERVADALPAGGALARIRAWAGPVHARMMEWRGVPPAMLPGGELVRLAPTHRHVTWNVEEYAAFRESVRPGDTVIDAGANAGAYALLFGQWIGPTGRVFAFEPDPRAFAGLQRHIALNGLEGRITPVPAALSDRTGGSASLRLSASPGCSRLDERAPADRRADLAEVRVIALDEFCARERVRPQVVKIDVEGAELQVLRGSRRTIASAGPDVRLFVEIHPAVWKEHGVTADDFLAECAVSSLRPVRLDGSRDALWETEGVCLRLVPERR